MNERLPSLFRYVENFFVACKQSQGNKQEQSETKDMASANHFQALFSFTSLRPFHFEKFVNEPNLGHRARLPIQGDGTL